MAMNRGEGSLDVADNTLESVLSGLRRFPDVEAPNLQAWDATDRLLLETAAGLLAPDSRVAVVGDRYGALTLGALAAGGVRHVQVHQDLITGERALRNNAAALGVDAGFKQLPLGRALFADADVVLLQLPKTLAELDEVADAVARYAAPHTVLLAGGRIKHMSLGMNAVLQRHFSDVQPQLARQKSRVLVARDSRPVTGPPPFPVAESNSELELTVCARGAVFAGTKLDIGTRFLLRYLPDMPSAGNVVDLGCGTGILAAMYAKSHPESKVTATDQSAAAVDSARATAEANGLGGRVTVLQDDAMSSLPDSSAGLILLNPPFHLGASVHAGAGIKMFRAAGRVLEPGGELWTVYNSHLQYLPALERYVGPTRVAGRNAKFTVAVSTGRAPHQ
ncbi:16S rRNA (guanine1207-N2)-methyltransferase [Arthrobacter sp. PvP102]|uniref:class I SAM-dependent methyltransferase n=1 Tax=unclassified Arthrobacter TaxID=235627 RepID=UPI001B47FBE8|nr:MULTISPECIES: class I SAM-dependent methyltransferase [unclassified Arthrobacter]MBP1231683.1 16S rRNA (guanine1207-N2)-methyltransferase [Arthrobacter sp. PvP103]MBP1236818.1 16S rRNA (guanine1207-N2)-methyltransferase [Arthrobacter sp. PvP102]